MSTDNSDVLVIGGGHNGLVCAAYLAAAGLKVRVLERRGIVGGAAVTEEFHPGFRNSSASYTVSLLNPKVIRDLRLAEHGLRVVERPYANFLPLPDGRAFRLGGERTQAEVAQWSPRDAERLPAYYAMLDRVVVVLRELMVRTPPNVSDRFVLADWLASLTVAKRVEAPRHARPPRPARPVHQVGGRNARPLVRVGTVEGGAGLGFGGRQFRQSRTRRAAPTCCCTTCSARSTARAACGAMRSAAWARSPRRSRKECAARGVVVETDADVAQVRVEGGKAVGVALADGREFRAGTIVSNLNPKLLYTKLVERGRARRRHRRTHRALPQRFGHVPHERRAVGTAGLQRRARHAAAAAPPERHPDRAVAALFRAGLFRCEIEGTQSRLGARADRRGGDFLDARRHPGAARDSMSPACSASTCIPRSMAAGTRTATRWRT